MELTLKMENENQTEITTEVCDKCREASGEDMQNRYNMDTLCE